MATLQKVQIFPAIGIARIGNSPEWYLGPELPFPAEPGTPPGDTYKDAACRIKKQAQRFRLWGSFSDGTGRELTLADGDITWTVHLVNAKPSLNSEGIIDGGVQTLDGAGATATFTGSFAAVQIPLGDAETDGEGRLIVRGGYGKSENPTDPSSQPNFPTTPGWYDDVSDGPITAQIKFGGTTFTAVNGAWVICPPPRYAPTSYSITTLYDTLRQLAITQGQLPAPGQPSFANDVYPILKRALDMRFVTAFAFGTGDHDTLTVFAPPGGAGDTLANRQAVYAKLRPGGDMPLLNDGGGTTSQLRDFQHGFIQQWSEGQVTPDWPPVAPTDIDPDGLTRAALENCVGAAFFPGIEAGGISNTLQITALKFAEPFRLETSQVQPGDVTKGMARPWQGDFMLCSGPESDAQNDQASWWPAARPIGIYPYDDPTNKRLWTLGVASSMSDMVANWHQLGFIVDNGSGKRVETEKTNVCKGCFFINNRPEISKDEAQALITAGQHIEDAFYVVVQGLAPSDLSITTPNPSSAQLAAWSAQVANPVAGTMTISPFDMDLENSSDLNQVQRITFGYNVVFASTAAFTAEDVPVTLTASIHGLSTTTIVDLTTRQHPYMVAGSTTWLSADTRVFKLQPNGKFAHQTLQNDPSAFIKAVIDSLRGSQQAGSWFDNLPADEAGAQLEWSQTLNGQPVFNFAICRVRYRSVLDPAPDVRVFFRLFPAMTTSTDFQPGTTYRTGGQPGTKIPLLGIVGGEVATIPFFAEARRPAGDNLNLQPDPKNVDTLKANAGGKETYSYFGCWLDINQPGDKRFPIHPAPENGGPFTGPDPLQSIADLIRGTHQCLVAEINFDLDPIAVGATTASSDKLAQRNLSIDHSDNPGAADTHRVQHSFSIRPTTMTPAPKQGPDELMIHWGTAPLGTAATLYLPGVSAAEIMRLADRLYTRNRIKAVGENSIQLDVTGGVSYIPVPTGGADLVGLLTLDLPETVRKGQVFRIIVDQVIDSPPARPRRGAVDVPPAAPNERLATAGLSSGPGRPPQATEAIVVRPRNARHIVGTFQFSVLVQTRDEILPIVERTLGNLHRVIGTIPHENRWYPVMKRYLAQVAGRVKALGGGGERGPCGDDDEHRHRHEGHGPCEPEHPDGRRHFEGKIAGIRFDGFGDFEGFWLQTKDGLREFSTRQHEMLTIANKAWREHISVMVVFEAREPKEPISFILLRVPDN
ncbi:LodA/GoxA family CTQ-dependent oxidase [Paraburkholderia fungorum]|uniref:LodA/GoxA family CTQ-dependent oxidase n=1 Tax=Paraburkholderia fungorum TaxID=134537 RepID=UPI0038BA3637